MSQAKMNATLYLTYLKKRLRKVYTTGPEFEQAYQNHLTGVAIAWLKKQYVHCRIDYRSLFANRRVAVCNPALTANADDINLNAAVLADVFEQATGLTMADPRTEADPTTTQATLLVAPKAAFQAYNSQGQPTSIEGGFDSLMRKAADFYTQAQPKALYGQAAFQGLPLCPYMRFYCQPVFTQPTGCAIAIDRHHVLIAGQGLPGNLTASDAVLLYDYTMRAPGQPAMRFTAQQCLTLQCKVATLPIGHGQAVTLYRTHQPVPARRVVHLQGHAPVAGTSVQMPAHPAGLPMKISRGQITSSPNTNGTCQASLLAEHGCAGAPVFAQHNGQKILGLCAASQHNITHRIKTVTAGSTAQPMAVPVFNPAGQRCTIIHAAAIAAALEAYWQNNQNEVKQHAPSTTQQHKNQSSTNINCNEYEHESAPWYQPNSQRHFCLA